MQCTVKIRKSVLPIYAFGIIILSYSLSFPFCMLRHYLLAALSAGLVSAFLYGILPRKKIYITTQTGGIAIFLNSLTEQSIASGSYKDKEAEKQRIFDSVMKADITDPSCVLNYGSGTEEQIARFASAVLEDVKTRDLGEIGDELISLSSKLQAFEKDSGRLLSKENKISALKAKCSRLSKNVEKTEQKLKSHQAQLLYDIGLLEQMYSLNEKNILQLEAYIQAGKKKIEQVREEMLPSLRREAGEEGSPLSRQKLRDAENACMRFEKKLHDLELSRAVAIQTAPQIRLVQSSNILMAEKLQSAINNTIPLWKNSMVITLGIKHSNDAAAFQGKVSELTNKLLVSNGEKLKLAATETAREWHRGIVSIEALEETNRLLRETFEELKEIHKEGAKTRQLASLKLQELFGKTAAV